MRILSIIYSPSGRSSSPLTAADLLAVGAGWAGASLHTYLLWAIAQLSTFHLAPRHAHASKRIPHLGSGLAQALDHCQRPPTPIGVHVHRESDGLYTDSGLHADYHPSD